MQQKGSRNFGYKEVSAATKAWAQPVPQPRPKLTSNDPRTDHPVRILRARHKRRTKDTPKRSEKQPESASHLVREPACKERAKERAEVVDAYYSSVVFREEGGGGGCLMSGG